MTGSPEIAAAFDRAGIDPVCWTIAVRRMMLLLSKGMVRTAHQVLEDFVKWEQISNCEGPIDHEYCQWMSEDPEPVVSEEPVIVRLPIIKEQKQEPKKEPKKEPKEMSSSERVIEAIQVLAENPDQAGEVIDQKIASLEAELDRWRGLRKTFGGARPRRAKAEAEPSQARLAKDWSDTIEKVRQYIAEHGPSRPATVGGAIGLTPIQVGIAVRNASDVFTKDEMNRIHLIA